MPSCQLKGDATHVSEAVWVTDGAEYAVVILSDRFGIPHEMERVDQLKSKAIELKQKRS